MRRAEWQRRADDPRGPLGWWWRGVWENGWPVFLFGALALPLGIATGMVWVGVSALLIAIVGNGIRAVRAPDRLRALLPDPAPEGQFRASVEYRRDGLVTGRDEMALTVVDGWLVGEGLRSHFALRSLDVRRLRTTSYGARLLLEDGGEVRLLGVLEPGRAELGRWHDDDVLPVGEPTFPPARAHEREVARWGAWMVTGLIVGASGSLLPLWSALSFFGVRLVVAVVGWGLFLAAMRHLGRLAVVSMRTTEDRPLAEGAPSLGLSPRPPLQNEPSGEGESLTAKRL